MNGSATIINYNSNAHEIVSAAGRISTTEGGAKEVYYNSCNNEEQKNINLIEKILSSGHESVLEHISINLAFDNVSVFVEQFLIEFRLASFTVKSRRYVDFGTMGYFFPDFSNDNVECKENIKKIYRQHMEYLFDEYNHFIQKGVPKEDARFVLPYSFKSNFFCTVNARELIKIMNEMVYGRGRHFQELVALGKELFLQCEKKLPYLNVIRKQVDPKQEIKKYFKDSGAITSKNIQTNDLVTLISGTEFPEENICKAAALNVGLSEWNTMNINNSQQQRAIIAELLKGGRKRELEQVNFTILFNRISLAAVTHLVRHRMQSIVIPDFMDVCNFKRYVLPESIVKNGLEKRYKKVFLESEVIKNDLTKEGLNKYDQVYLMLSGMTIPVMTTMNANELYTFIKLRTCNRAQWEIKECSDALLHVLRDRYPVLFSLYGPSCYVLGRCPEGKMTCGLMKEMRRLYSVGGKYYEADQRSDQKNKKC